MPWPIPPRHRVSIRRPTAQTQARRSRSLGSTSKLHSWRQDQAASNVSSAVARLVVTDSGEFQSLQSLAETIGSEAVLQLKTAILLPLSTTGRSAFQAAVLRPSRGAILYGPAGNGKTLLAAAVGRYRTAGRAAAGTTSNFNRIEVHAAELISAVSGESEKNKSMFARARSAAPSILSLMN